MSGATVLHLGGTRMPVYKRDCLNTILCSTGMYGHTYWVVWAYVTMPKMCHMTVLQQH